MAENDESLTRKHDYVRQIVQDQTTVIQILQRLDSEWKRDELDWEQFDLIMHRFDAMRVVFEYLAREKDMREEFLAELNLTSDEVAFFRSLEYPELRYALMGFLYLQGGVKNHLLNFGEEGVFYDVDRGMLLAQFSIYAETGRLMQSRDHVDDIIWLADKLISLVNKALESSRQNQTMISENYIELLKVRLSRLDNVYQELNATIDNYPYVKSDEEFISSERNDIEVDTTTTSPSTPAVDIE